FACPKRLVGTALGWSALAVALSSAAGPSVGATILAVAGWRWLFAVNLPIGALVLLILCAMPAMPGSGRRLHLVAILLNAGGFGGLAIGVDVVALQPAPGVALLAAAAIGLAALIRRELPLKAPLIPLDLLRVRPIRLSVIASVCCFTGQMAGY